MCLWRKYYRLELLFLLVYDPDPISSLRKRRVSTDSHDSAASHPERASAADFGRRPPQADSRQHHKISKNSGKTTAAAAEQSSGEAKRMKVNFRIPYCRKRTTVHIHMSIYTFIQLTTKIHILKTCANICTLCNSFRRPPKSGGVWRRCAGGRICTSLRWGPRRGLIRRPQNPPTRPTNRRTTSQRSRMTSQTMRWA